MKNNIHYNLSPRSVTHTPSPRSVGMRGIMSCLFRPISRIETLRDDEAGKGEYRSGVNLTARQGTHSYMPLWCIVGRYPTYKQTEKLNKNTFRQTHCVGFTLVELLVVVLIIGILSAVALPMYQGAVDKSRWSTLLAPAKALQTAQTAAHMETGSYAYQTDALSISLPGETDDNKFIISDAEYSIDTKNNNQSMIIGELNTLPNVRLSMALKNPDSYLFCDAKTGDTRAERLCEKLLGGTKTGAHNGYTKYLLDSDGTCIWGSTTGQCYTTVEEKCDAAGALGVLDGKCKYRNTDADTEMEEGSVCIGDTDFGCEAINIDGGACISLTGRNCDHMTITSGICVSNGIGEYGWGGCMRSSYTNGSICYANVANSCGNYLPYDIITTYDETSCCCGAYCGNQPSCASRGKTCDPYYMDPNNFKNL